MVARLQSGDWERSAPHTVLLRVFEDVDVLRASLPYLSVETLGKLMPKLSNEARLVVLGHTSRASVLNSLAHATDMSEDVLKVFADKAGKVACRNFLHGASNLMSPTYRDAGDITYDIWLNQLTRNKTLHDGVPLSWSREQVKDAFNYVTDLRQNLGDPWNSLSFGAMNELWRNAEIAEVVTEDQRLYWFKQLRMMTGPLKFYAENGLVDSPKSGGRVGTGSNAHVVCVAHYGDVQSMLDLPSVSLRSAVYDVWLAPVLKWSPRREEVLNHVEDNQLTLLALGATLDEVLGRAESVTDLFRDWYDINHVAKTVAFPEKVVLQMPPTTALYVVGSHSGEFDLDALTAHVEESLGSSTDAWQFFWENAQGWKDSLELLLETAVAVS